MRNDILSKIIFVSHQCRTKLNDSNRLGKCRKKGFRNFLGEDKDGSFEFILMEEGFEAVN